MSLTISQLNPLFLPEDVIRDPTQVGNINHRPRPHTDQVVSTKPPGVFSNVYSVHPISLSTQHSQQVSTENNFNQLKTELSSLFNLDSLEHIKPKRKKLDNLNHFQFITHQNSDSEEEKTP